MAKREDWTSFGISGSGKSRKNSLSNVATSCTPVSIERVICPPRSNSSRNWKKRKIPDYSENNSYQISISVDQRAAKLWSIKL